MRILAALVVLTATASFAQTKDLWIFGDKETGNLSGKAGEGTKVLEVADDTAANGVRYLVHTVSFFENSDRPCRVSLNDGKLQWRECSNVTTNDADGASQKNLNVTDNLRFSGVQVCMNNDKDKIKGVRLFVSEFEKEGIQQKLVRKKAQVREFVRPNCDDKNGWMEEQRCAAGSMLVGLKIDWRKGKMGGSDVATGLSPICRSVVIRTVTNGDAK